MADPEVITALKPREVTLTMDDVAAPRFTPRELDLVKAEFGRAFSQVLGDEQSDDKLIALAWLKLRRQGVTIPLDQMADVVIELKPDVSALDPTNAGRQTISPPSAATGE